MIYKKDYGWFDAESRLGSHHPSRKNELIGKIIAEHEKSAKNNIYTIVGKIGGDIAVDRLLEFRDRDAFLPLVDAARKVSNKKKIIVADHLYKNASYSDCRTQVSALKALHRLGGSDTITSRVFVYIKTYRNQFDSENLIGDINIAGNYNNLYVEKLLRNFRFQNMQQIFHNEEEYQCIHKK